MNLKRAGYTTIALGCLFACAGSLHGALEGKRKLRSLSPCELVQVHEALKAVKAAGYGQVAADIRTMLLLGAIIVDPTMEGTYRGAASFPIIGDQVIRLNPDELFCRKSLWKRRSETLYRRLLNQRMVILSSTLVHEWWHVQCGYIWTSTHPNRREVYAWSFELEFLKSMRRVTPDSRFVDLIDTMSEQVNDELKLRGSVT